MDSSSTTGAAVPPPWLAEAEVAIVGLGLMGGSLAAALRGGAEGSRPCRRVVGVVRSAESLVAAEPWVDAATTDLDTVATADVVVLATPARTILQLLPEVAARMRPGALLTDLGSTKRQIVAAMAACPAEIRMVGGHPMCGKESGGLAAADALLYTNAPFIICPVPGRGPDAGARLADVARACGARPYIMDAVEHDRVVAAISHTPYTTAVALVRAAEVLAAEAGGAVWALAAGGFRDTTRVAGGEIAMWIDILLTNRDDVLAHLARVNIAIAELTAAVSAEDVAALTLLLQEAQSRRRDLYR